MESHVKSLGTQFFAKHAHSKQAVDRRFMAAFALYPAHEQHQPFSAANLHAVDDMKNPHSLLLESNPEMVILTIAVFLPKFLVYLSFTHIGTMEPSVQLFSTARKQGMLLPGPGNEDCCYHPILSGSRTALSRALSVPDAIETQKMG
jgi:hypothetical protein